MALPDIISKIVDTVRKSPVGGMRVPVQHLAITGRSAYGPTYATSSVEELALIEDASEQVYSEGKMVTSSAKLTFLEFITVQEGDKYTFPDGLQRTVLRRRTFLKPDGSGYITEVWLGE